jgi:chromate transporter
MKSLISLFLSFIIIGIGAYGGGLVTIPLIQHEIVSERNWLRLDELGQLFAIAQMTPGPIAINAVNGYCGAFTATSAVILPSILILLFLTHFIDRVKNNAHFIRFRHGLEIGVISLILFAVWSYGSVTLKSLLDLVIFIPAFAVLVITEGRLHPVLVIFGCGILGILIF